ncbi:hypothetical protein [Listeria ilorinensis]|uniref:hypothetical protein n=1 Tax=Listeria ilorinensis TaxID=2867439 RepID=UPI001EF4DD64|nr:hypothetical protein [Listeria ilorinensis]
MVVKRKSEGSYYMDISLGVDPVTGKQKRIWHKDIPSKRIAQQIETQLKQNYYSGLLLLSDKHMSFDQLGELYFKSYTLNHKPTYIRT